MHCSFVPRLYIGSSVDVLEPARRSPVVWSYSFEIAVIGRAVVNNLPIAENTHPSTLVDLCRFLSSFFTIQHR